MANNSRIEWVDAGFGEILQSPALQQVCVSAAKSIASRAGEGFEAHPWTSHAIGKSKYNRVAALVSAETIRAKRGEAKDKRLQKAVAQCSIGSN